MRLKAQQPALVISPERIKAMDEQGIDTEALSINPVFWYKAEPDLAAQVIKLQNEKLAEICAVQLENAVSNSDCMARWSAAASMAQSCPIRNSTTTPGLSDAERAAILGATAEKLLAIKPA
jgi:hypothetical protein